MNARQRRDARRTGLRRAYARSQRMTAQQAMRPQVGKAPRVSYAGSGAAGYGSEWSQPGNVGGEIKPVVIDRRWSDTLNNTAI